MGTRCIDGRARLRVITRLIRLRVRNERSGEERRDQNSLSSRFHDGFLRCVYDSLNKDDKYNPKWDSVASGTCYDDC